MTVKEGNFLIFFVLDGELDAFVDLVEAGQEVIDGFHTFWWADAEFCEDVVDIFLYE